VAFGVVLVIAVGDYFLDGKKRFKGPRIPIVIEAAKSNERVTNEGVRKTKKEGVFVGS
jgi:hypothetical protein